MNRSPSNRPYYKHAPLATLAQLSRALDIPENVLIATAREANQLYRPAKPVIKENGKIRQPYDALPPLKHIQERIKVRLLIEVVYPEYLTGSIRKRDQKTNAERHTGAGILFTEDIENFFPSTKAALVYDVWHSLFRFGDDVSRVLTLLTTRDGHLEQGAKTSSYLANLVLWKDEPGIYGYFLKNGFSYTRHVDDISVSSCKFVPPNQKHEVVATIYAMLGRAGYKLQRTKHQISSKRGAMMVTKLLINRKASITKQERGAIRSDVWKYEMAAVRSAIVGEVAPSLLRVRGRVERLKRYHTAKGKKLQVRLAKLPNT